MIAIAEFGNWAYRVRQENCETEFRAHKPLKAQAKENSDNSFACASAACVRGGDPEGREALKEQPFEGGEELSFLGGGLLEFFFVGDFVHFLRENNGSCKSRLAQTPLRRRSGPSQTRLRNTSCGWLIESRL